MSDAENILKELVEEIATDLDYKNYELKTKPISTEGANYTTVLFVATISAPGKEDIEIFAKVCNLGEKIRNNMPVDRMFITERYVYTELLNKYRKLEEDCGIKDKYKLNTAKYYTSNTERFKETLVLENLIAKGYILYDRFKSVDWAYASQSIKELAKLHALSIAYGEENPEDFKKILSEMKPLADNIDEMKVFWEAMTGTALNIVAESNRDRLNVFLKEKLFQNLKKYYSPLRRPVLAHGDYRQSNLMHKVNCDGNIDVVIVDYQTLQAGCPIMDLLYFIFNCSDEAFRTLSYRLSYFDKLVEHYYTQLRLALQRLHVDPDKVYPREDFDYELKEMLPFGLSVGVFTLQIVTVESANAPKLDGELSEFNVKTSDLFSERLNGIVNDYIRWGII